MSERLVRINDDLSIPLSELAFETSRSSGPGGQHVNKTESRVTLVFDLDASTALSEPMRQLVAERCANRISKRSELRVSAQTHRSQRANRETAIERFAALVAEALAPVEERKPTRTPARAKRERLEAKRRQAEKKSLRQRPTPSE